MLGINELTQIEVYDYIKDSLKTLLEETDLEVGLLPFLKVNSRFIIEEEFTYRSILLKMGCEKFADDNTYTQMASEYEKKPEPILLSSITPEVTDQMPMFELLYGSGIRGYLLLPLYANGKIVGVLEE